MDEFVSIVSDSVSTLISMDSTPAMLSSALDMVPDLFDRIDAQVESGESGKPSELWEDIKRNEATDT